eukprot:TRINITY_DN31259_c0_g1_i2.p1 TRINITY_DN31259_c0_g1~~TRINITY_DN31259_c0_g1_i2.p1  ORF type:complete len:282 (+),score=94.01 TRINITY_DN31259_c0_g1_i2:45-890(+)
MPRSSLIAVLVGAAAAVKIVKVDQDINQAQESSLEKGCCYLVSAYGVEPHVSWGTLTQELRHWWSANRCNAVVGSKDCSKISLLAAMSKSDRATQETKRAMQKVDDEKKKQEDVERRFKEMQRKKKDAEDKALSSTAKMEEAKAAIRKAEEAKKEAERKQREAKETEAKEKENELAAEATAAEMEGALNKSTEELRAIKSKLVADEAEAANLEATASTELAAFTKMLRGSNEADAKVVSLLAGTSESGQENSPIARCCNVVREYHLDPEKSWGSAPSQAGL